MAKYLNYSGSNIQEVIANSTSAGVADADKMVTLNAAGEIDQSMMPAGIGADTLAIVASEDLLAGDLVNIFDDAGTVKVRKAVATGVSTRASGFVLEPFLTGASASVYLEGKNTSAIGTFAGGLDVFLSTTAGEVTNTAPSGTGNIAQLVGRAVSNSAITTEMAQPILLA